MSAARMIGLIAIFFFCGNLEAAQPPEKFLVVSVPVADIRSIPQDGAGDFSHDDANETQALYNEVLVYKAEQGDWYQVEAPEQQEFSHRNAWQGYPGWIRKNKVAFINARPVDTIVVSSRDAAILKTPALSAPVIVRVWLGTQFKEIGRQGGYCQVLLPDNTIGWISEKHIIRRDAKTNEDQQRSSIVKAAKLFLGTPYLWGGRSLSGVDCSGLVNLAYRASGIEIPRDAHEQWMVATPILSAELKPGDLIFLSKENDVNKITHVMLSLGKDEYIEAPGTGKKVRLGRLKDYAASGRKMYFGKMLP